jgi:hypothetical protein
MKTRCILATVLLAAASPLTAQKPGTSSEVPLAVTIADRSLTEDYRIESDGSGAYVHGQNGVAARLDQYGNLIINFGGGRKGGTRRVSFDYACPYENGAQCNTAAIEPPSGLHDQSYVSTVCPADAPCPRIQEILPGVGQCVQLNWQFIDAQGRLWRNGFHRTRDLPNQQGTAFAVVTRNLDHTWSVEPSAASCQAGNAAGVARTFLVESVKGRSVFTDYGEFWLPFRLTLASLD